MYVVLRRSDHTAIAYRLVRKLPRVAICVQVCAARQFHLSSIHGGPTRASRALPVSMPKFKGHSEFVAPSLMMPRPSSSASLHRFPEHVRYAQVLA